MNDPGLLFLLTWASGALMIGLLFLAIHARHGIARRWLEAQDWFDWVEVPAYLAIFWPIVLPGTAVCLSVYKLVRGFYLLCYRSPQAELDEAIRELEKIATRRIET